MRDEGDTTRRKEGEFPIDDNTFWGAQVKAPESWRRCVSLTKHLLLQNFETSRELLTEYKYDEDRNDNVRCISL